MTAHIHTFVSNEFNEVESEMIFYAKSYSACARDATKWFHNAFIESKKIVKTEHSKGEFGDFYIWYYAETLCKNPLDILYPEKHKSKRPFENFP